MGRYDCLGSSNFYLKFKEFHRGFHQIYLVYTEKYMTLLVLITLSKFVLIIPPSKTQVLEYSER